MQEARASVKRGCVATPDMSARNRASCICLSLGGPGWPGAVKRKHSIVCLVEYFGLHIPSFRPANWPMRRKP